MILLRKIIEKLEEQEIKMESKESVHKTTDIVENNVTTINKGESRSTRYQRIKRESNLEYY